jgi:hypothetical protein
MIRIEISLTILAKKTDENVWSYQRTMVYLGASG